MMLKHETLGIIMTFYMFGCIILSFILPMQALIFAILLPLGSMSISMKEIARKHGFFTKEEYERFKKK